MSNTCIYRKLLSIDSPIIINHPEDKFETLLFLPPGEGRKGDGGLRTKGYFKHNYKLNPEDSLWYICDTAGNLVKPALEEIQREIVSFVSSLKSSEPAMANQTSITELPLISVITVVLNGEKYLEQTIQSVINQTYPNVEYIIIDGGSTDGTLDIIERYEDKIDYWVSEKDWGIYDAMNKGVRVAVGSWIGFLGSDDFYELEGLYKLIFPILSDETAWIVYGNSRVLYESELLYIRRTSSNVEEIKKDFIFFHPDSIAKIKLYKKIGLYDTKFCLAGDYEFFLRAYFNKYQFIKVEALVLNYRVLGFSSNYKKAFKEKLMIKERYNLGLAFFANAFIQYTKCFFKSLFRLEEKSKILMLYRKIKHKAFM